MGLYVLEARSQFPLVVGGAMFAGRAATDRQIGDSGEVLDLTERVRPIADTVLQAASRHDQAALVSAMAVDHLFDRGLHSDTNN